LIHFSSRVEAMASTSWLWLVALVTVQCAGITSDATTSAAYEKVSKAVATGNQAEAAKITAEEVDILVQRGHHQIVKELVELSHKGSDEDSQRTATKVRQAIQAAKNRLDDLTRALDRNYGKAVEVSPAAQWAQNSTHIFVTIKFAQRWNAPGALEVENETVEISDCCFNFTAFGEHSFIVRRYHLSWHLHAAVLGKASSWHFAAAGRMAVTFVKADAKRWPSLVQGSAPKNLGVWRDMQEKWSSEMDTLEKGTKKAAKKEKKADDEDDEDPAELEADHISRCKSTTYRGSAVAELCGDALTHLMSRPVKGRKWLVQFYHSEGKGDTAAMRSILPIWKRLADVYPSSVPGGRVAVLDCAHNQEFCTDEEMATGKGLPKIEYFTAESLNEGVANTYTGSIPASLEDFIEFGTPQATKEPGEKKKKKKSKKKEL